MKRLIGLTLVVILLFTGIHFLEACAGPASAQSTNKSADISLQDLQNQINTLTGQVNTLTGQVNILQTQESAVVLWSDTSSIMDGETIGKGDTIQNSGEETILVMFTAFMFTNTTPCLPTRISIKDGDTVSESFLVSINQYTYTIISIHDVITLSPGTHNIHIVASGSCVITQIPVHRTTVIIEP